jgi:anti-sigma regulatory factor (Ser/Thr protein kinase)
MDSARIECELRILLPATLAAIEEFFVEFRLRAEGLLERRNCFAAELLVREALTNAVVHGCAEDPAKKIHCRLRLRRDRLLIAVADEGAGFDWRSAREHTALESDISGRGMEIYYRYAQRVRFNDKGNAVTIIKQFEKGKYR